MELACRVLFQLLQLHQDQIVANRVFRPLLDTLRTKARQVLAEHRVRFPHLAPWDAALR